MNFGQQLRKFRLSTQSPKTGKSISQEALGELLHQEMGIHYTGAAVSDWERGKSRINADNRLVLISLVKILNCNGGIKTPGDANLLLESGNFRALNKEERVALFPDYEEGSEAYIPPQHPSNLQFLLGNLNLIPPNEFQALLEKAKQGPAPLWPRIAVSFIRKFTFNNSNILKVILWFWIIWLTSEFFIGPSLKWNFESYESAQKTMVIYAAGSLIVPALIGGMTNTNNNLYWVRQNLHDSSTLRLYVHQGAYVGYHVGYFVALLATYLQVILRIGLPDWLEFFKILFSLGVSYVGAQLIPYNLWLAHSRLWLKDGGVFFIFIVLGPLWALFFLEFYELLFSPVLGTIIVLSALTILPVLERLKRRTKNAGI